MTANTEHSMIRWSGRHLVIACTFAGIFSISAKAQTLATPSTPARTPHSIEILYSSSVRPDGAAEITLSLAGSNGMEIDQQRSTVDRAILSRTVLAPVVSDSLIHLSQVRLILEKEQGSNSVVLVLHPQTAPSRSLRLVIPCEPVTRTGAISMDIIFQKDPGDGSGGSGGDGCYPYTYTSDRCGTIKSCCPSPSATIDGVRCTITCD